MKLLLTLLLLLMSQPPASPHAYEDTENVTVTVTRVQQDRHSFFQIDASGFAHNSQQKAWEVLTDYDRLHAFVPHLLSSKLLERNGAQATIEQQGRVGFFIFSHTVHLVVHVTEYPFSALDIRLVAGDMKHYVVRWELAPAMHDGARGTRISYSGMVEPDFFVPSLLGAAILRADAQRMLEAVIAEIDKFPERTNSAPPA